ncbi:unnamed protein product [Meloidogyne enterolobii]|uniref:Uncharacterized protein n=1 Tax=Meloidogyne enterolobii TaxID=390850 RepID=A0ACB0XUQ7_MELEN
MRESLYKILEINSGWLTEEQKGELRKDLKNGKSLDGEIYEKVFQWFSRLKLTLSEWSEAKDTASSSCYIFSWKVKENHCRIKRVKNLGNKNFVFGK